MPRAFVVQSQRMRIIDAMLKCLPRHGYAGTTISHLAQEGGVSRVILYEQFGGKEECFLATYDLAGQWLCERVSEKVASVDEWPARIRIGAAETIRLLSLNPTLAHLFSVEVARAGRAARKRQDACLARFADALRAGRPTGSKLPVELEDLLLGGALSLIARYVDSGRSAELPDVTTELLEYLLIPYLGPREAKRIVAQAA